MIRITIQNNRPTNAMVQGDWNTINHVAESMLCYVVPVLHMWDMCRYYGEWNLFSIYGDAVKFTEEDRMFIHERIGRYDGVGVQINLEGN